MIWDDFAHVDIDDLGILGEEPVDTSCLFAQLTEPVEPLQCGVVGRVVAVHLVLDGVGQRRPVALGADRSPREMDRLDPWPVRFRCQGLRSVDHHPGSEAVADEHVGVRVRAG